jgi:nitrogen fixation negative regulator NifL
MKKPHNQAETTSIASAPPTREPSAAAVPAHIFEQAVSQADVAISITDPHAKILYVNSAFTRVAGYGYDEVVGRNESILSNKTTPPEVYKAMWQKIGGGEAWHGRLVNLRKDGTKYLADLTITPVLDADGQITNFLGMHRDITELHQLECQVRNQKALIESVVDAAPMAFALLDDRDKVVIDNAEYKKLMGDLAMAEPASMMLAAIRAEMGSDFGAAGQAREGYAFLDREVRIERRGWSAPRWFSCSAVWVREDDDRADAFFSPRSVPYLLLVAKEVTSLRAEQEKSRIAALQAVLSDEDRIARLRESLSAAVFQLEGPINVIASAVGMLTRRIARGSDDPMAHALAEAVATGQAALESLRNIIPAQPHSRRSLVNLNEALRDVLDLATKRILTAGITVAWQPQTVLPGVHGEPQRLRALFKALVDNAIEAMNVKGWQERELRIATRALSDSVEVIIEDSGPGVPADQQLKVFEPFFTTKHGALGTGLSAAQQVVADHGGLIEIDPGYRAGCRVRVALPTQHEDDEA